MILRSFVRSELMNERRMSSRNDNVGGTSVVQGGIHSTVARWEVYSMGRSVYAVQGSLKRPLRCGSLPCRREMFVISVDLVYRMNDSLPYANHSSLSEYHRWKVSATIGSSATEPARCSGSFTTMYLPKVTHCILSTSRTGRVCPQLPIRQGDI
jgi:hypothetical protein